MIDYYEIKSQPITRVMVLQAYKKVRANKGSGGVDDMDWEWLDNNLKTELYKLCNRLTSGRNFPTPLKRETDAYAQYVHEQEIKELRIGEVQGIEPSQTKETNRSNC